MDTKEKHSIADRLRFARENAGLSQGQVAKLLDLHRPSISEIEAGRRKVSSEELTQFAKVYDVDINWLSGNQSAQTNIDDKILLAARYLVKLKKQDLDNVLNLIRVLKRA